MTEIRRVLCPICEVGSLSQLLKKQSAWNYLRCDKCGILCLAPLPNKEVLAAYYNDLYTVPMDAYECGTQRNAPPILRRLNMKIMGQGKRLDIGCSYGFFLDTARKWGWDATGIELDEAVARYGVKTLGLRIFAGMLESELTNLRPPYDAIVTFDVLEHVPGPVGFLRKCRQLLRSGGVLILKTPNVASPIAAITAQFWQWLSLPAHVHLFSSSNLRLALEKSGFQVEAISSQRGDAHSNLFELGCAAARYIMSRKRKATGSKTRQGWANSRYVNAAKMSSEVLYWPIAQILDPWLAKNGLQPELLAIAFG